MATSTRQLLIELYQEHLEEASFLYEQRLGLLDDSEVTWTEIAEFEDRFEAHIDALVLGEDLALEVCRVRAVEGDFGEVHAAVRVFCRQDTWDAVQEVLEQLDSDNAERVQAVSDALKHELPDGWKPHMTEMLAQGQEKFFVIAARVIGYRRMPAAAALLGAGRRATPNSLVSIAEALGRLLTGESSDSLLSLIQGHEDEQVCAISAVALLRAGNSRALQDILAQPPSAHWAAMPVGLGAARDSLGVLESLAVSVSGCGDAILAMGLLGNISAVPGLIRFLANDEVAPMAALALNMITGQRMMEEVFIPEEIGQDEFFGQEKEKQQLGESLDGSGADSTGATVERLSQDPQQWTDWWKANSGQFDSRLRYRRGELYSPAALLEVLESPRSSHLERRLAPLELSIRYGVEIRFESDLWVPEQRRLLVGIDRWVQANENRYMPGKWYLHGQLQD